MADNWSGAELRKRDARYWVDYMWAMYSYQIRDSINRSEIIVGDNSLPTSKDCGWVYPTVDMEYFKPKGANRKNHLEGYITLLPEDTISAVVSLNNFNKNTNTAGKIGVLNFASFKHPGGRFIDGSKAQEECICHESTLYPVLKGNRKYYEENTAMMTGKKTDSLYADRLLYTPDILMARRREEVTPMDVITCAAPNLRNIVITDQSQFNILLRRATLIIDTAYKHSINELVLGAWGCGVFRCNPKLVAEAFLTAIYTMGYPMLYVFAIPFDIDQCNYLVFKDVITKFRHPIGK